jgi:acyl-CoA thioesterase-1
MLKISTAWLAVGLCSLVCLSASAPKTVLFLGDSLTAGYGLDPLSAFPSLIQQMIDKNGLGYQAVNAGVSGDTSAGGARRIAWLLKRPVDVLFLELGANDGLRGIPLDATEQNLQTIIDRTKAAYPDCKVIIAGMMVPPNLGPDYSSRFQQLFRQLADRNNAVLMPFLLEGVAGRPNLNLPDGIHPTEEGHRIIAGDVWKWLQPILADAK